MIETKTNSGRPARAGAMPSINAATVPPGDDAWPGVDHDLPPALTAAGFVEILAGGIAFLT